MNEKEETLLKVLVDFATDIEGACLNLKHKIAELVGIKEVPAVKEETFTILKWEKQQGNRLGEFEVAYEVHNISDKWSHAYGILRQSNATINNRYHGPNYEYSYWLYGDGKIYRQKLKPS
jgi:polysaccharide pyruvyl transferase WcaK-like protein